MNYESFWSKGREETFPQGYIFFKFLFLFEMLSDLTACQNFTVSWVCDSAEDQFCRIVEEPFLEIRKLFASVADPIQYLLSGLQVLLLLPISFQCSAHGHG